MLDWHSCQICYPLEIKLLLLLLLKEGKNLIICRIFFLFAVKENVPELPPLPSVDDSDQWNSK